MTRQRTLDKEHREDRDKECAAELRRPNDQHDITECNLEVDSLREFEENFRAIFDNAVDGIVLTDLESKKFYRYNRTFYQIMIDFKR